MGEDDVFDDREAESCSSRIAGAVFVDAVEALKDVRLILEGNPCSIVGDRYFHPLHFEAGIDLDERCARFAVADGIGQKIPINLFNPVLIHFGEDGFLCPLNLKFRIPCGAAAVEVFDDPLGNLAKIDARKIQPAPLAFHAGNGEQVFEKQGEPLHIAMDRPERHSGHLRILCGTIQQRFHIAIDDRDRGAEFMRNIRHKFPAGGLQRADGGDFLKHDKRSLGKFFGPSRHRRDMDIEVPLNNRP